ncbi:MAG: cupin domain-containing protein [Thermoproteota archaeon]
MKPIVIHEEHVEKVIFQDRWSKDLIVLESFGFSLGVAVYDTKEFGKHQVHSDHEILYIVSGGGEVLLDDEIIKVEVGTAIYIPPGCKHAARITGQLPLKVVYMHAAR